MKIYDSIIVGSGPAGLSAAIYLARFLRSVLVIDTHKGRSTYSQLNENYLGFPEGIHATELRDFGTQQAKRFGVKFKTGTITHVEKKPDMFLAQSSRETYYGKTILLCTGVTDIFPLFKDYNEYVGKSLFWCITCDGYKTQGKKIVVVGATDDAACTAMQFLRYTENIIFITNCEAKDVTLTKKWRDRLQKAHIQLYEYKLAEVYGENGYMHNIVLDNGQDLSVDLMFNQQGAKPNSQLAQQLGVAVSEEGYIKVGLEQRTNIPGVYAAGDVTRLFSHQVVTAAHEGSMAAQAINYDLYPPELKR